MRAPRKLRVSARLHAALTAVAFVLASLVGLVHEISTTHVRCAEHGELIHGDATLTVAPVHSIVRELPAGGVHDGHEHCSLTSATRQSRIAPHPPTIVHTPIAIATIAVAGPRVIAARGERLFRTAPKTSPPA